MRCQHHASPEKFYFISEVLFPVNTWPQSNEKKQQTQIKRPFIK